MLGTSTSRPSPEVVTINRKAFRDIFHYAYGIIRHLISHLDWHLSLKPGTLASFCPQNKPSQTMLRMLRSPSQTIGSHRTKLIGHTDLGSMTILFKIVGGLQLLPAGSENIDANWAYIRPEPGRAVINLGDAMVQWSGGVLRSNVHRWPRHLGCKLASYATAWRICFDRKLVRRCDGWTRAASFPGLLMGKVRIAFARKTRKR